MDITRQINVLQYQLLTAPLSVEATTAPLPRTEQQIKADNDAATKRAADQEKVEKDAADKKPAEEKKP